MEGDLRQHWFKEEEKGAGREVRPFGCAVKRITLQATGAQFHRASLGDSVEHVSWLSCSRGKDYPPTAVSFWLKDSPREV